MGEITVISDEAFDGVGNPVASLLHRLRQSLPMLSSVEKIIGRYILEQPRETVKLPLDQLARQLGVSQGSVVHFCQTLGFNGFKDFKLSLAAEAGSPIQLVHSAVAPDDDVEHLAKKIISANIDGLLTTLKELDLTQVERAVEALTKARRIDLYGFGVSSAVALDAYIRFLHLGLMVNWLTDVSLQLASAALLTAADVAIAISYSGDTEGAVNALSKAKSRGATTIAISSNSYSALVNLATIKLIVTPREPAAFRNLIISSRIAMLSIIDIIYLGVVNRLGEEAVTKMQQTNQAEDEIKPLP